MTLLDVRTVVGILGALLFFLGVALLAPMLVSIGYGESEWPAFAISAGVGLLVGGLAWWKYRPRNEFGIREGFVIVASSWFVLSLLGAAPFVLGGVLTSYTDAFFETMSGLTTTGATILGGAHTPTIESLPRAFLFWRSLAHWLGGMGIIVLTLAILPILGVGGMQLFRAEVPGPSADKLTPRVKETAKRLWLIYFGITVLEVLLLLPAMDLFESVNHAFATMATGGFSTRNGSVGDFNSPYVEWVITVFMIAAGVNFSLHYRLLRGKVGPVFRDPELRFYLMTILVSAGIIAASIYGASTLGAVQYPSLGEAVRMAVFQAASIVTTTGFGTADYELWPPLAVGVMFFLFFAGGMAGSTGGGIKAIRHLLLYKHTFVEIKRLVHPQAIIPIRLNDQVVSTDIMRNVLSFVVLYVATACVGAMALTLVGMDLLTALGGAISALGNIGPAFGTLGPTENYAHVPAVGKWVLSMLMMLGRLEIFTVLVLFVPAFWRR